VNQVPIILLGYSRGSMATGWAMHANFVAACRLDLPGAPCGPAKGMRNILGAMLLAPFAGGAGYRPSGADLEDRNLLAGALAQEHHTAFYPSSEMLSGMQKWPAAFFAKGLWDRAESLEGTMAAYQRVRGLKELVVVREPHTLADWRESSQRHVRERMVAFALALAAGKAQSGARPWSSLKELAATSPE